MATSCKNPLTLNIMLDFEQWYLPYIPLNTTHKGLTRVQIFLLSPLCCLIHIPIQAASIIVSAASLLHNQPDPIDMVEHYAIWPCVCNKSYGN